MSAPIIPGAYLALRRIAAGRSIEDVAADVSTEPATPLRDRAAWLRQIEAGEAPIALSTVAALRHAFDFDMETLLALADAERGMIHAAPQICRICGCSWDDPCDTPDGPCGWAETDRCTACPPVAARKVAA